jgi:predicted ATPase/DNA-binding CsgD family transcriptional regulator
LLTLTGPGGSGKTRLALAVAVGLSGSFEGRVFFVSLAAITEPTLVAPAVAQVLGLTGESGDRPPEELLKRHLRERRALLLLLDNFEQVLGAAPLVGELLSAAPRLKVLATSRAPLKLYGEQEFSVPPLPLPDLGSLPPPEELARSEAVGLFVERARAVKPDFRLDEGNARAVAEICARLDGLPLAIELAAARTRLLPPEAMVARLGSRLELSIGGARDVPERQRTLRAALDWSHELLSPQERTLFARLSVFSGGRTLEAMEAVCDPEGGSEVMKGVEALLAQNLLTREEGIGGEPRFVMLETVHEYAREKLKESGEAEAVKRAHSEYFLALAEEAEPHLLGAAEKQAEWSECLGFEHDNLRAALSWSLGGAQLDLGLRLAGALWRFWEMRGHHDEARGWLEEALAKTSRASIARAKALEAAGWMSCDQGDFDRMVAAAEEGLRLCERPEIQNSVAAPFLQMLGSAAYVRGDFERAARLYKKSLALSRQAGDRRMIASSLRLLGNATSELGDYEAAKESFEEGLALSRSLDNTVLLTNYLTTLGEESLLQGDYAQGAKLNEGAAVLLRERGQKSGLPYALDPLGWATLMRGDLRQAKRLHEECLNLSKELGDKLVAANALEGLACIAASGDPERAAKLFGAAKALREAIGHHQTPRERALREPFLRSARARLGDASWEAALTEGEAMEIDRAESCALSVEEPPAVPTSTAPDRPSAPEYPAGLTAREVEVLKLVAEGMTNARIAQELYLSPRTVHRHLNSVYHKLGTNSRASAARFATEHGLL